MEKIYKIHMVTNNIKNINESPKRFFHTADIAKDKFEIKKYMVGI